ncbi:MAG: hypothetical protein ACI4UU_00545 [Clostridia bacterium]
MENEEVNESANNLEVAEQEEVVESTTTETEEVELNNEQQEKQETSEETVENTTEETTKQSKEDNQYARMARIKAEKEAEAKIEQAKKEAYEQGLAQGKIQSYIGKQNPYTGEIIKDDYDVKEYLDMYELDTKGKDPINGYRELQKEKARQEAEEKIKKDEEDKQKQWYQNDTKDFVEKYSSNKLQELTKDEDFNLFANGKIGKVPLAQIYEDYKKLISKYEKKSVETAKQIVANNTATPGAIQDSEAQEMDWNSMSSEQFEKYMQKAINGELK